LDPTHQEAESTIAIFKQYCDEGKGTEIELRLHTKRESLNTVMRQAFSFRYSESLSAEFREIQEIILKTFEMIGAGNPSDYMTFLQVQQTADCTPSSIVLHAPLYYTS
jgi:hypothetical protein